MILFWGTLLITVVVDRISKLAVLTKLEYGQSFSVIPGFFHLTYVKNAGAAFGMLAEKRWLFILITLFVVACMIYWAYTSSLKSTGFYLSLGLLAGGALGNLCDRVQTGLVIDFLDFRGIWPYIFNVADSAIVVGVIFLSWQILRSESL